MDVTPQLIAQIHFSDKFRGYDQDEVDDFLERVGATLSELLNENQVLSEDLERAHVMLAEERSRTAAAPVVSPEPIATAEMTDDEEIAQATRTLTLAKRTAEAAIAEARAEAAKMVSDARSHADAAVADAQAQRNELLTSAKRDADAEFAAQRSERETEIGLLEESLRELSSSANALEMYLASQRSNISAVADQLRQIVQDPGALAPAPIPTFSPPSHPAAPPAAPDQTAAPVASPFYPTGSVAAVSVPDQDVAVVQGVPDGTSSDPWGPGSWSDVEAGLVADDPVGDAVAPIESEQAGETQQQLTPEDAVDDESAMGAFFDADVPSGRRFRRR